MLYFTKTAARHFWEVKAKNLFASGFLFVGGAILMLAGEFAAWVPIAGSICALIGIGMLIYFVFSKDGKYDGK
jgi:CHASE2 domain-containing sensor protein